MIAYHYPPVHGSSGYLRTLKFSQYLPCNDWIPIILSVNPRAYPQINNDQIGEIPSEVKVYRAFALDTAKHLSISGKYFRSLAQPDRWITWWLGAVPVGLYLIRKFNPGVIWSTYPIATAHLIGLTLHKITGIPWIADFRDSMVDDDYPPHPTTRKVFSWIESQTIKNATQSIFAAPGTLEMYADRYSDISSKQLACIRNGYDEDNFSLATRLITNKKPNKIPSQIVLVHSGLLQIEERDPRPFFSAIAELKQNNKISSKQIKIVLRASGNEQQYFQIIKMLSIDDIVFLEPSISYNEALAEMMEADGLLIFQATTCNHLIPAKLYEYIRARKPILAITDQRGETAGLLRDCGINTIVDLTSKENIKKGFLSFLAHVAHKTAPITNDEIITRYSRKSQAEELASIFSSIINTHT